MVTAVWAPLHSAPPVGHIRTVNWYGRVRVSIGLYHGDEVSCHLVNDLHGSVLPVDLRVKLMQEWIVKYNW